MFRRSRGYAPNYFGKKQQGNQRVLAMGGDLKSTIGFLPNDYIYISQYLGNLDHYDVYHRFEKTAIRFIEIFEQQPDKVLVDAHPAYHSSQLGLELGKKFNAEVIKIQHHKAHFASVLAEHELFDHNGPILGVIWDGTGYGDDSNIWGGEFFEYHSKRIQRVSHFTYFDWLAGDKMAQEPRLSFFSLSDGLMPLEIAEKFTSRELAIYKSIKKKNQLNTSSVGRLFDAVASLLNICNRNTYEGEAAILLENCIGEYYLENCTSYANISDTGLIPTKLLFWNLYSDFKKGVSKEIIITNFLFTLATLILQVASKQNTKAIALSGGVFQNTVLIDMLKELAESGYKLYFNRNLSPNDENISFGQINYFLNCKEN
jgi:hydrogenase maturation protein HypF